MIPPSPSWGTNYNSFGPPAIRLQSSCANAGLRDSCRNVTQGHSALMCNIIYNIGWCAYVSYLMYRSGRGWRPFSVCVQSIIRRTVLWSWLRWWGAGCWGALRGPARTKERACPFREQTDPRGRQRSMRKPKERSAAAQRAHIKR